MEEIISLISIVKRKSQRSLQLVNQNFRKHEKSKDNLLYEGLINGNFTSEKKAAKTLFNADPSNRNFRNTKAKLKNKLLNHLYFLDYNKSEYTEFMRIKYELLHALHQMNILLMEDAGCIALKKLPQLIRTAKDFELVEIALDSLLLLRNEFSLQGKCTPLLHSEREIEKIKPFHQAILHAEELYYDTMVLINKSLSSSEKIIDDIPQRIAEIDKNARIFNSSRIDLLARKLEIEYNSINHDYSANLKICNYIEEKYIGRNINSIRVDIDYRRITFLKIFCLYALSEIEEGINYAADRINFFKEGTDDWFAFREYQFLIYLKGEKIHQATKVFRAVRTNKNFGDLDKELKERWLIYRAYILFVNDTKLIKWGFDLGHFLQSQGHFPKKRAGYTIATLIIQYMFYLRNGDIKMVKEKLEQLEPLSSTHLDKRHNYRNSIFIRMLELIEEKEYDFEIIKDKGQTYLQKLIDTQIPPDFRQELEVIPFEKLWEYILNILKTNKNFLHYRFYHLSEI